MSQEARTERPTPRHRQNARRRGRVPRSLELTSALVLLATGLFASAFASALLGQLEALIRSGIARAADPSVVDLGGIGDLAAWALRAFALAVVPIVLVAAVVGVGANIAQVGFYLSPLALKPTLSKLNAISGLKRMFGRDSVVEAGKAVAKTAIVGLAAFLVLSPRLGELASFVGAPPGLLLDEIAGSVRTLILAVGGAFLIVAAADYAWQRYRHERSLRMTKEELRQDLRQTDLSPEVKRAIRRRQLLLARRRMLAEVPKADVVVVNPVHVAVALRYDGSLPAPEVVAKGAGVVASAISRVAREHGVPVVHNAPLARALYKEVEIGRMIPEAFFVAVAEVLAFVYRTTGRWPRLKPRRRRPITEAHAVRSSSPPQ